MDSAHAWYARGLAASRTDRHEEALTAFRRCRTYDGRTAAVPIDPSITGESAAIGEAEALVGLGRKNEARAIFHERLKTHARSARTLIGLLKLEGDVDRMLKDYRRLVGGDDVPLEARLAGAEALVVVGETARAARWLEETGSIDDPQVTTALGEIHLHAGRLEEAHAAWSRSPGDPSCRGGTALVAAMLGRATPDRLDHEAMTSLRNYLVNLKRSGRDELFQKAARACVEARLLGGSGGG